MISSAGGTERCASILGSVVAGKVILGLGAGRSAWAREQTRDRLEPNSTGEVWEMLDHERRGRQKSLARIAVMTSNSFRDKVAAASGVLEGKEGWRRRGAMGAGIGTSG